jgi:hypothetical protein
MPNPEQLNHAHFTASLSGVFEIVLPDEKVVEVELIEVSELRENQRQERFSLLFRGPRETLLPQQLYNLRHESLGEFELFLVPVAEAPDGFVYEAVFNRLRKADDPTDEPG